MAEEVPVQSPPSVCWYSRPELNRDQRFRKPLLYPFELREHEGAANRRYVRPGDSSSLKPQTTKRRDRRAPLA